MQDEHMKLNPVLQWQKQHSRRKNNLHHKMHLNLRTKPVNCYMWSIALCGAGTRTLRKVDQK
jgi:hypothetical protein